MAQLQQGGGVGGEGGDAYVGGAGGGEDGFGRRVERGTFEELETYRPRSSLRSPCRFPSCFGTAAAVAARAERTSIVERMVFLAWCCDWNADGFC